ncbi:hypothetical protein BJ878DRAFT_556705 [Calycina marina]|uniref:Uncharacterized protein n=1 Tax=Calycina marina TaxID=1763456 RepID=A0A9P7YXV0_9HELO|nr:hypothetical protein BJ878DRAFT_556705 [Calycina marina]
MSRLTITSSSTSSSSAHGSLSLDKELLHPPTGSISCLYFSRATNHLPVGSWTTRFASMTLCRALKESPLLLSTLMDLFRKKDLSHDGRTVVGCGADKTARILDLGANGATAQQVAAHDAPIKAVKFITVGGQCFHGWRHRVQMCLSIRWKTRTQIKYPPQFFAEIISMLVKPWPLTPCHRGQPEGPSGNTITKCYAINAVATHPKWGIMASAGSDGAFHFWDRDAKQRLKLRHSDHNQVRSVHS